MPQQIRAWDGKDWQDYIVKLLKLRYGFKAFQDIPDGHGGDFGLEGFSTDGCVYQCYAPQEPLSKKERYEKQRDKLTEDINKFIDNREELEKIFGGMKVSRYVFLVPKHDSALLNQHAESKAAEVRSKNLPYVSDDFRVHVGSDDFFPVERQTLVSEGVARLHIEPAPIEPGQIDQWANEHGELIENLVGKLKKLPAGATEEKRERLQDAFLKQYLVGEGILTLLHEQYPDVFESIHKCKTDREELLAIDSLIAPTAADKLLADTIKEFVGELSSQVPGLDEAEVKKVAYSVVADWLLRCPLDF